MLKPVGSASKTKVTEKERKIEEEHIKEKIVTGERNFKEDSYC